MSIDISQEYKKLNQTDKEKLHTLFKGNELDFSDSFKQIRQIIFTVQPPSPEEFLDHRNGFISYHTEHGLYPYIKDAFLQAMSPKKNHPVICVYGSTRIGKSVLSRLFVLYTAVFVNYLRDPHLYFNINKMSKIGLWLLSFKEDKTKELLLDPLLILLSDSLKFKREHFEKEVYRKGVTKDGVIHFSEAGKFGSITFPHLKIATGRDPSSIVGSDIIAGVISELTFFKKYAPGFTDEMAKEVYDKLRHRISSTIGESNFPCWTYIDTSANDADSPLEKYILKDIAENPKFFFRHYCLWEARSYLFPEWNADRSKTFPICVGDGSTPPKILESQEDINNTPANLLLHVPIDLKEKFESDLVNQIRDTAGRPTTSESKYIQNEKLITDIFIPQLRNVIANIKCDSKDNPEGLIWNKIESDFFVKYHNKYIPLRAPKEGRYVGIDLAYSKKGDVIGLSIGHKEWSRVTKRVYYVSDMTFAISAGDNGINITAVALFIKDLVAKGCYSLVNCVFDTFQSESMAQLLQQNSIPYIKNSVDRTSEPYTNFYTYLVSGQIYSGKNIFLKNNLKSLYRVKDKNGTEKIDHSHGKLTYDYNGNWQTSQCGIHAKDLTDAFCNWVYVASQDSFVPSVTFEDENERMKNILGLNDLPEEIESGNIFPSIKVDSSDSKVKLNPFNRKELLQQNLLKMKSLSTNFITNK